MTEAGTEHAPSQKTMAKAALLLLQGKVSVDWVDGDSFEAFVTGSKRYWVAHSTGGRWRCECQATRICSHIIACQAIWDLSAEHAQFGGQTLFDALTSKRVKP